jgi:hypothetical protein
MAKSFFYTEESLVRFHYRVPVFGGLGKTQAKPPLLKGEFMEVRVLHLLPDFIGM